MIKDAQKDFHGKFDACHIKSECETIFEDFYTLKLFIVTNAESWKVVTCMFFVNYFAHAHTLYITMNHTTRKKKNRLCLAKSKS